MPFDPRYIPFFAVTVGIFVYGLKAGIAAIMLVFG